MAGLMRGGAQQQPSDPMVGGTPPEAAGTPDMTGADTEGGESASPEEQRMYEQFVENGMKIMYSPETRKTVKENLAGAGNPIEGFARTLVLIVSRVHDSAKQAGKEIPGDVIYNAAEELMDLLIEYAGEARIATLTDEQTEQAWYLALDMYRAKMEQNGEIDPAVFEEDMAEISQAESEGRLDEVLPGIGEAMNRAPAEEQEQPA